MGQNPCTLLDLPGQAKIVDQDSRFGPIPCCICLRFVRPVWPFGPFPLAGASGLRSHRASKRALASSPQRGVLSMTLSKLRWRVVEGHPPWCHEKVVPDCSLGKQRSLAACMPSETKAPTDASQKAPLLFWPVVLASRLLDLTFEVVSFVVKETLHLPRPGLVCQFFLLWKCQSARHCSDFRLT